MEYSLVGCHSEIYEFVVNKECNIVLVGNGVCFCKNNEKRNNTAPLSQIILANVKWLQILQAFFQKIPGSAFDSQNKQKNTSPDTHSSPYVQIDKFGGPCKGLV